MTRLILFSLLAGAACATAFLPPDAASAPSAAAQTLDRTYVCKLVPIGGGLYDLEARGHSGTRSAGAWARLPFAAVSTGEAASIYTLLTDSLAWVTAGRPTAKTTLEDGGRAAIRAQQYGTLAINTRRCARTRARVALTARGLEGGVAGPLGDEYNCEGPQRVLVRIRARSASAIRLSRDGAFLKARVPLRDAYVAARTQRGKPLAFVAVAESGKTRVFSAPPPRCFPD